MKNIKGKPHPYLAIFLFLLSGLSLYFFYGKALISISYDPHEVNCLPELHLALLVHIKPESVAHGDYVFWKAYGPLSYVKEDFVLKKVAGLPGDKLQISNQQVFINGAIVANGFGNAILYAKKPKEFEKEEVIPAAHYFVIGTNVLSNDSRYWGYLPKEQIVGKGYRIY